MANVAEPLDSRGEQPAGLFGQTETGQQANDEVHDEEQQVGQPPAGTQEHTHKGWWESNLTEQQCYSGRSFAAGGMY